MSKGSILIEVMIASLIFCVFAASFAYLVGSGIKIERASVAVTRSALACKSMLEELRSKPFDSIFLYNGRTFDGGRGMISVEPAGNNMASIKVTDGLEFETLRSRY